MQQDETWGHALRRSDITSPESEAFCSEGKVCPEHVQTDIESWGGGPKRRVRHSHLILKGSIQADVVILILLLLCKVSVF